MIVYFPWITTYFNILYFQKPVPQLTMNTVVLQLCLAFAMFLTTAIAGLIPIKLVKLINKNSEESKKASWIMTLLSCFGGGVFIATCFLDIFPHVAENFEEFKEKADWHTSFPVSQFCACLGFFLVYFLEEISLKIFSSGHHGHFHGHPAEEARGRTASVTDATTSFVNGIPRGSVDEYGSEKYIAVKTHE